LYLFFAAADCFDGVGETPLAPPSGPGTFMLFQGLESKNGFAEGFAAGHWTWLPSDRSHYQAHYGWP
jgi:hypothetical protein